LRLLACLATAAAGITLVGCGASSSKTVTKTVTISRVAAGAGATSRGAPGGTTAHAAKYGSVPGSTSSGAKGSTGVSGGSPTAPSGGASSSLTQHLVDDIEQVHITSRQGPDIIQQGVVTGTPIGSGTVVMHDRLTASGVNVSFTVTGGGGTVTGLSVASLQVKGSTVKYSGTAHLTGGTGRYSRVRAPHLTVTGSGLLSGQTTLHVTGLEWY
jgi:hypothetical protein